MSTPDNDPAVSVLYAEKVLEHLGVQPKRYSVIGAKLDIFDGNNGVMVLEVKYLITVGDLRRMGIEIE